MRARDENATNESSTLAKRLRALFDTVRYRDRRGKWKPYSTKFAAESISADPEHATTIGANYLDGLRNGRHTNPSADVLRAIAKFFNDRRCSETAPVTVDYLLGSESDADRVLRARLQEHRVRAIAMRAGELDAGLQDQVLDMLEMLDELPEQQDRSSD